MANIVRYDEAVLSEFARRLYRRALSIIVWCTILGLLAGGTLGGALAEATKSGGGIVALVVLVGGLIGYAIGSERAFMLRLQAQVVLCQVQIERNTRALAGGASFASGEGR